MVRTIRFSCLTHSIINSISAYILRDPACIRENKNKIFLIGVSIFTLYLNRLEIFT